VTAAIPNATAIKPGKSIERGTVVSRDSRTPKTTTAIAAAVTGTLTSRTTRQSISSVSPPPNRGPSAVATAPIP
jgi:hypothetical protein